ncbi:hypothetical protein B0H13DRAFT_2416176 [Mycena leptocephala]|nr:hypothetical protein B0H13DRAFT_2416176 [Mycena leptocephala]
MSQQRRAAPASASRGQPTARGAQDKENNQVRHHTQAHGFAGDTHTTNNGTDKETGYRAASKIDLQAHHNNDSDDGAEEDEWEHRATNDAQDDDESPVRRGRVRRISAKQAQLIEDMHEAEARKTTRAEKAAKTAKKHQIQELRAMGQEPEEEDDEIMEPRRDDTFTSRTVQSRPTTTKVLAQRNSKVPPPPTFPSDNWRATVPSQAYTSTQRGREERHGVRDNRDSRHVDRYDHPQPRPSRSQSPVLFRGRSPTPVARPPAPPQMYNINGGRIPDHLDLNLHRRANNNDDDDSSRTRPARPPSPAAGDKRARSPADSDDMRTAQAQRTNTSAGRPKAKDFDDVTPELIALTITFYRCYASSKNGFPDHAQELKFVADAWRAACQRLNLEMEITPTISKLITNRGSHLRGELKTKMKPTVELVYGFKTGQNKKTIAHNRQLAERLKEDLTFTFKDITNRKGIYRNIVIQKAVNSMWFANRRDEGPSFPEFFNPFPKAGLALVLTVCENLIDERITGIRTDVPFTTTDYRSVYESHLKALTQFEEETGQHKILDNILVRLHNIGRFHSGAQPITAFPKPVLSKADVAAAIKEYMEDSETESDAENGADDE